MGQYNIDYACGHSGTVRLFDKINDRMKTLEWLQTQKCPECKREEENRLAAENAAHAGRPALVGSEKQVAWAMRIREDFFSRLEQQSKDCFVLVLNSIGYRLNEERPGNDEDSEQWRDKELQRIKNSLTADGSEIRTAVENRIQAVANAITSAKDWIDYRTCVEQMVASKTAVDIIGRDVDEVLVTFKEKTFGACKNGSYWLGTIGFVEATDQNYKAELAFVRGEDVVENGDGTISVKRGVAKLALSEASIRTNNAAPSYVEVSYSGTNL